MSDAKLIFDILAGKSTVGLELTKTQLAAQKLERTISGIGSTFIGLKSTIAGGLAVLGIAKAIEQSNEFKNALIGLRSVAGNTGNSISFIEDQAKDLAKDGLIPLIDVSNSLKNLLSKGFSGEEAVRVFKALRDSAAFGRAGQLELGEAIKGATDGIKNENSTLVDNAGITKNLSVIYKEYASTIGKTVGQLSEADKRQAFLTVGLKEAAVFQGDYNKLLNTFSGLTSQTTTGFTYLIAAFGDFITRSPAASELLKVISEGLGNFTRYLETADASKLGKLIDYFLVQPAQFWVDFFGTSTGSDRVGEIDQEMGKLNKQLEIAQKRLKDVSEDGKGIKGTFFSNLLGGFEQAQTDIIKFTEQLNELKKEKDRVLGIDEGSKEGTGKRLAEANQVELDAERKKNEDLLNIKREFDLVKEEERLANNEFINEQEKAEFEALIATVGERNAQRLQAEKNLANGIVEQKKNELNIRKAQLAEQNRLEEAASNARKNLAQQEADVKRNILTNSFALASALAKDGSKAQFLIQKAGALAQVYVADGMARGAAVAQTAAIPYPANLAALAQMQSLISINTALATGVIAAQSIKGFQDGGIVRGLTSSGDSQLIAANRDEMVLTRAQQTQFFNTARGMDSVESNSNNSKVIDLRVNIDGREIARVLRDLTTDGFRIA